MYFKKIGIAYDHAGIELKNFLLSSDVFKKLEISEYGIKVTKDVITCDYPDYVSKLALAVSSGVLDGGIAICGTGIGMSICANKFPRIRAVSVWDTFTCEMSRIHNNSNILCLGARVVSSEKALKLAETWLSTSFSNEKRHKIRLEKIEKIEAQNFKI